MTPSTPQARRAGFTFLELLLALSVGVLVTAILGALIHGLLSAKTGQARRMAGPVGARAAVRTLAREISGAFAPPVKDLAPLTLETSTEIGRPEVALSFYTPVPAEPRSWCGYDIEHVTYEVAVTALDHRELRRIFDYLDRPPIPGTSLARIELRVPDGPFEFHGIRLTPLPAAHGRADMIGWKIEHGGRTLAAIPDCKHLPPETVALCHGADLAVIDALRIRPHPTHMNFEEAGAALQQIGARRSLVIHLCHEVSHAQAADLLPTGMEPAYDGLRIEF